MIMYHLSQSVFSQRQDAKDLGHSLYTPGATGQTSLYGAAIPAVSGLSTGIQGLSLHPAGSRGLGSTTQYGVSRSTTAPAGYGALSGMTGMSQLGAPSPPPTRGGVLPLGSGRAGLIGSGQGMAAVKPSRPTNLSSAIGSSIPVNTYGGLGRSAQGMMSPMSSGYGTALSDGSSHGFDLSDFPVLSLTGRSRQDSPGGLVPASSAALPQRPVGQLPKSSETVPGFQMHSEDFPALPGTSTKSTESLELSQETKFKFTGLTTTAVLPEARAALSYDPAPGSNKDRSGAAAPIGPPKGTKKSNQATTVSIPPGMVQDQFGMMGLLTFIRGAETDPNLVHLALGSDLTTLGLNLNSPDSLYNTFASPWSDAPCRAQDIDYSVPQEYLIHPYIRDKLAPIRLNRYNEDLLFYLYYSNGGDLLQLLSAAELYARDWRYHKDERIWITRAPGMRPTKQESTYEEGTYCYFDTSSWRKAHKEFHVEYDKLEERPQMPPNLLPHQGLATVPTQA